MRGSGAMMFAGLALAVSSAAGACASDEGETGDGAGESDGGSAPRPRQPVSVYDAGLPEEGRFCSFVVAAECDGSEDCADGMVCCGTFNGGAFTYDSIRCEAECDPAAGGFLLCHEGDVCPVEGDVCRRSLVLPDYLSICTEPSMFAPTEMFQPSTAASEVNCGHERVCGAGERCCVMTSWDAALEAIVPVSGTCADQGTDCACPDTPNEE